MIMRTFNIISLAFCLAACSVSHRTVSQQPSMKFSFGTNTQKGYSQVPAVLRYAAGTEYGIDPGSSVTEKPDFITSDKPFYFSVKLPEGNYNVKVTLGDKQGTSDAAIRAECRRMMVNRVQTKRGEIKTVEFTVHVRDTLIRSINSRVRIKDRERSFLHWDDRLTLEFNGENPKIRTIEITPTQDAIAVFLAGNSTVVDQGNEPWAAWGQMIPAYFTPGKVVIANYAESGEALSSFISARRFEKILSFMRPGDYAFVEFGHNDMKQRGEGIGAFTSYKKDLKYFIAEVKKKGGNPVLVTSMQRRSFNTEGKINQTLGDYPEAVRQTAREENVPLIDLNAVSKIMYEAWGVQESLKAFVHFPANTFPGQTNALADNTHFSTFGADQIAKLVLKGIRENVPALAKFIKAGIPYFDPAKPGNISSFYWPLSPSMSALKPDGN